MTGDGQPEKRLWRPLEAAAEAAYSEYSTGFWFLAALMNWILIFLRWLCMRTGGVFGMPLRPLAPAWVVSGRMRSGSRPSGHCYRAGWMTFGPLREAFGWPPGGYWAALSRILRVWVGKGQRAKRASCVLPGLPGNPGGRTILSKPAYPAGG